MPLTSDGELVDQTPMSTQSADIVQHAPPLYGQNILDQLYADVDQSGIMTPAPQSGMNTPFHGLSRTGSSENLASLDGVAHQNGAVPPAALSSRLQNLDLNATSRNSSFRRLQANSGVNTPYGRPHADSEAGYFDPQFNSAPHSNPLSRRTSEEEDHQTPGTSNLTSGQHTPDEHVDYSELGDLARVPSYQTAVKTPIRGTLYNDALPNYETAVSAPPSPERTFGSLVAPGSSPEERRRPFASIGFTAIHPPPPAHVHDSDDRRRLPLHIMQSRGRSH